MPSIVHDPARPSAPPAPAAAAPAHTAERVAHERAAVGGRRGVNWRHVIVAAVVGVLAGAALPGGIQVAERAAARGDQSDLRDVAMEHLTAIADGRASDATAVVAARATGEQVPDAVLQSATRITQPQVRLVHIDGDAATVEAAYTLGQQEISRTLEAERIDGAWQLSRPLTEAVPFHHYGGSTGARIAGFELEVEHALHLYPGIYTFDAELEDPVLVSRSEPFTVDGDPTTPSEPFIELSLAPSVAERAEAVALAVGERCQATEDCGIPADANVRVEGEMFIVNVSPQSVEVIAQISSARSSWMGGHQLLMQIDRAAVGDEAAWLCSALDAYELADAEPCPSVG